MKKIMFETTCISANGNLESIFIDVDEFDVYKGEFPDDAICFKAVEEENGNFKDVSVSLTWLGKLITLKEIEMMATIDEGMQELLNEVKSFGGKGAVKTKVGVWKVCKNAEKLESIM